MIERTIKKTIIDSIHSYPVTLICGARQVGKSTLCYQLEKELGFDYVSLDVYSNRLQAINNPELFLREHKAPLIIDEVQYAPKLFEYIEAIVNEEKHKTGKNYGMYVLTGSQIYRLMQGVSQSLAGRVSIIQMFPLSMNEITGRVEQPFRINLDKIFDKKNNLSSDEIYASIVKGFYPELYDNSDKDIDCFYDNYLASYLDRDVSEIIKLNDKNRFLDFVKILASLTGEELVYDNIAKSLAVDMKTIKAWTSVLEAGNIIHLLHPYNEQFSIKGVIKRPKVYFNDTGLACHLAGFNDPEFLKKTIFKGRFVETYIINEIIKSYMNNGVFAQFYYYRDQSQNEIDLIIVDKATIHMVECKAGSDCTKKDCKAFDVIKKQTKLNVGNSAILSFTEKPYSLDKDIFVLPINCI